MTTNSEYSRKWARDNPEKIRESRRRNYIKQKSSVEGHARFLLESRKKWAKRRGVAFEICLDDLRPLPLICPVLGIPLAWCEERKSGGWDDFSPSIDKVDPTLGYVPGNVRVISMRANRIKSDASLDDLEAVLKYLRNHLGNK